MAFHIDITKSSIYQEGFAVGYAEGYAVGFAMGYADGNAELAELKLIELVRKIHAESDMPLAKIARICHLSEFKVKEILKTS